MAYANIRNIKDVLPYIEDKPEFMVMNKGLVTIIDYNLSTPTTFDNEYALECRGITFWTYNGEIVQRPLHKFFNLGEGNCIIPIDDLKYFNTRERDYSVYEKLDGSMIGISKLPNGELLIKTRQSFSNEQSLDVKAWLIETNRYEKFLEFIKYDYTYIFEWTSPKNCIVVRYTEPNLTLLDIRHNITGEYLKDDLNAYYLPYPSRSGFLHAVGLEQARKYHVPTLDVLLKAMETENDSEGYVVKAKYHDNEVFFKLKNDWYCSLHRAVSYFRERDVALVVLEGGIDDYISRLKLNGIDTTEVEKIYLSVVEELTDIEVSINYTIENAWLQNLTYKDVALGNKNISYVGLIMRKMRGQKIDIPEWYRKNILKQRWNLNRLEVKYVV